MARRTRILAFGSAATLVVAGSLCAALVRGLTGQLLTIVLLSLGLGGAMLLVFLEIGLSEDRDRAREDQLRRRRGAQRAPRRRIRPKRPPRRPS